MTERVDKENRWFIGYFGCSEIDRIVSVTAPGEDKRPHHAFAWEVECPCGGTHIVKPMWRIGKDTDEPEIVLGERIINELAA